MHFETSQMPEEKPNRPKDHPLYQQRLKAWTPLLTMRDACIFFLVMGLVVIGVGLVIFFSDNTVQQYMTDYTNCISNINGQPCSANNSNLFNMSCTCNSTISIKADMALPIYFYYGMTNYYQNHRQFANSLDMNQLTGSSDLPDKTSCSPLLQDTNNNYYAPCGQMANAIFNDTFVLVRSEDSAIVPWSSTNISMESDRKRFGKPTSWTNRVKPPSWPVPAPVRNPNSYVGDEELMVWLRPSALPTLRKLHRILRQNNNTAFQKGLPKGNYTVMINYNYPVTSFGGTKSFIISDVSWIGGKNPALAILYLITGSIEILIGIVLLVLWLKTRHDEEEPNELPHELSVTETTTI